MSLAADDRSGTPLFVCLKKRCSLISYAGPPRAVSRGINATLLTSPFSDPTHTRSFSSVVITLIGAEHALTPSQMATRSSSLQALHQQGEE